MLCTNTISIVQISEKWQSNGRTTRGAIELDQVVLRRKRKTE